MTKTLTQALEQVAHAASVTSEWRAELDAAEAAQRDAMADRPKTPAESQDVAQRRVAARERVTVARDAVETAKASELAARRAAVGAEADSLDTKIRDAHKAVEAFRTRLVELLKPLQEHTGQQDWGTGKTVHHHVLGTVREAAPTSPRERELVARVRTLEETQAVLRRAASGEALDVPVADLPASLQAGGILPDPRAAADAQDALDRQADADAWAATVAAWQAEADAAAKVLGVEAPDVLAVLSDHEFAQANADGWLVRLRGVLDVPVAPDVADALRTIGGLCGSAAMDRLGRAWVDAEAFAPGPQAA